MIMNRNGMTGTRGSVTYHLAMTATEEIKKGAGSRGGDADCQSHQPTSEDIMLE